MQAFINACAEGSLSAEIAVVISNKPSAAGLDLAAAAGIPTVCVDHKNYDNRETFDAALLAALAPFEPDLVILAGFMRILTPVFIEPYAGRLLNIHPSLLPKYPGLNTHQRALDAGDSHAGVTVHFVTPELDGGPPIVHAKVAIESGDTADTLATRILEQEHRIYPLAVRWHLNKQLKLTANGASLNGKLLGKSGVLYDEHSPDHH